MLTHFGRAVARLSSLRKTSARAIARHAGINPALLSRACKGARPEAKSLNALCTSQPVPKDGLELLVAHLQDEVERAGRLQTEVRILIDDRPTECELRFIVEEARRDPQLRQLLYQLADFLRTHVKG